MGLGKIIGTVFFFAAVATGSYFGVVKPLIDSFETERFYHQALFQYADTNHDGIISAAEQDAFDVSLLKDKGVTLVHGRMPRYLDGTQVPHKTVTEWVRDYKPN